MKNKFNRRKFLVYGLNFALTCKLKADSICKPTLSQPKGPFYQHNYNDKVYDLTNKGRALGEKIEISGKVMNTKCKPYSHSLIKIWQANSFGKYSHVNDYSKNKLDPNFLGYSSIKVDRNGYYKFITIKPAPYEVARKIIRTPHIHFLIAINNKKSLSTQLYFKDHPLNSKDFLFNTLKNKKALELTLKQESSEGLSKADFNFII